MTKKFLTKLGTGIATGGIILGTIAPAAFAATPNVIISKNGSSKIVVSINKIDTTTLVDTNVAAVTNVVVTNQNTGFNTSLFGGGSITTGGTSSSIDISNLINQ